MRRRGIRGRPSPVPMDDGEFENLFQDGGDLLPLGTEEGILFDHGSVVHEPLNLEPYQVPEFLLEHQFDEPTGLDGGIVDKVGRRSTLFPLSDNLGDIAEKLYPLNRTVRCLKGEGFDGRG